ncbi:unnamed protein product [Ilex paraguariensis]|uniref:RPAP1/MINIYO-like TPR repeats domain-containing protein n=1 Tax=Ilex paraguariensis TaxID=185542 RepID=A0ABC8UID5_9AQUA
MLKVNTRFRMILSLLDRILLQVWLGWDSSRNLLSVGDPSAALEESIISILIAIARHSPTCSEAIMNCQRLVQTIVDRFTMKDQMEFYLSKIKSVTLLKALARSEKKNLMEFVDNGIFQKVTWHLYRYAFSPDHWVKLGRENCKLSSALLVEQLRFWKIYSLLSAIAGIWLDVPSFEKLIEYDILNEFAAITKEAYLVLEALTRRLPNFYSHINLRSQTAEVPGIDQETWCWGHVGPIVDLALKWTALNSDPYISKFIGWQKVINSKSVVQDLALNSILWVLSAVMHMLSSLLKVVIPEDISTLHGGHVPWLPDFVPKIGLQIIKNGFLNFSGVNGTEHSKDFAGGASFLEHLCDLRHQREHETSIASVCCLHGLVQVVVSVDELIRLANTQTHTPSHCHIPTDDEILSNGILESSIPELGNVVTTFTSLIASEWQHVQSTEMFGRGGPAPGVGVGWGASGGGFWSTTILLAQMDASLFIHLLEVSKFFPAKGLSAVEEIRFVLERICSALEVCLIVGPREKFIMDKVLDILNQVPVLKYLDISIRRFLHLNAGFKLFEWEYKEEDYLHFCTVLASHFRNRWLSVKKKVKAEGKNWCVDHKTLNGSVSLDTIQEDVEVSTMTNQGHCSTSLVVEWAHQRLPLPPHWFLSPISTINPSDFQEVAKAGLFFLLGIETISTFFPSEFHSSVQRVPVIWKLHALSVIFLGGMGVLQEEKSRDVLETLQEVYGQILDNSRFPETGEKYRVEFLNFQSEIHESYSTFMETLVEQFAAVSYGDMIYGRQVAIYLQPCVESSVRLSAWNALFNARALELLPPLDKCIGKVEGYLEPVEDDERVLEAYAKSWVCGALDKAATRGSVAYTLVLHHMSSFIFGNYTSDKILLRNKLAKSLLRDYSCKQQHKCMMVDLIRYKMDPTFQKSGQEEVLSLQMSQLEERFKLLKEACEGNSSLLSEAEKLESSCKNSMA